MDTSPALLLLLALGCCCPGIHGLEGEKRFMEYNIITYLQQGAKMSLTCRIGGEDTGVVWVHQKNVETFKFIVFISPLSGAIFEGNQKTSPRYEARKEDMFYYLVVKSFTLQDEGNYFCIKYIDKQPYFSPGQLVFLSVTTTVAPTTCAPSPKHGITEDPNIPDPASRTSEDLDYFCLVFLWVPLAGLCLLLLQLLATTLVLRRFLPPLDAGVAREHSPAPQEMEDLAALGGTGEPGHGAGEGSLF